MTAQSPNGAIGPLTEEARRLHEDRAKLRHWKRWGPYLSERQWGTVREDYSADGTAWDSFPHDHARSRAYRWGEDGLAGISDNHQRLCLALALWNGADPILKERLFGLTGPQGNHGEDVKEYYFYLDNTPTHSFMKCLYKYPQRPFPYQQLVEENERRGPQSLEYELLETGVFADDRYFDIVVEYAKASPEDILMRVQAINRGPDDATLHLLPTLWFRNTWAWTAAVEKPLIRMGPRGAGAGVLEAEHPTLKTRWVCSDGAPTPLFTENETNTERLFGVPNRSPYVKDAFHACVVHGQAGAVNPERRGTKAALWYRLVIPSGRAATIRLRLTDAPPRAPFATFETIMARRRQAADAFYQAIMPPALTEDHRNVQRQAFAGMLWSKQFYHYVVEDWLAGDPAGPPPPASRRCGRNRDWTHLYNDDILSIPDAWEYPWFAAWDLAFHCIPLALVDPEFAKRQLLLLTREWYMHPNGQLPAYEWAFGDVNPPVHAWAAWRVYKIEQKLTGQADRRFLERVFQKLLLNFTWWVNRKDAEGRHIFQGGFLGLDNIGVFDRSAPLPTGGHLEQSDGTSWMAMYCLNMLTIALELARHNPSYEDIASKFFEHFLYIAQAMTRISEDGLALWDEADGFFYDALHFPDGRQLPLKVRSMVGLIPLCAVETLEPAVLDALPGFTKRMAWFIANRPDLCRNIASLQVPGIGERRLLSLVSPDRLRRIMKTLLDPEEFLSDYGIRSLSQRHRTQPYILHADGSEYVVRYEPAESATRLFGGNSNWRGPVWFPVNFLLIEALQKFHHYLGDAFQVDCPTTSGRPRDLWAVSMELSHRLMRIFSRDAQGRRPVYGGTERFHTDPHWRDLILFHEYFHGENGAGIGASHQTGWTGLVAKLIQQCGEYCGTGKTPQGLNRLNKCQTLRKAEVSHKVSDTSWR